MSGMMLFTQTVPPNFAIVQGAYNWLWPNQSTEVYSWEESCAGWICEITSGEDQYQLFEGACVDPAATFNQLVEDWRADRGVTSSTSDILLNRAYQSIIGMGQKAVPLILSQMETEGDDPDQWFYALQVLTGANPVREEDEGDFQAMARAWLDWARRRYVW